MIEIALMIEGQNGLTWEHWQRIARLADEMGFAGLYRSDHFTNANPPDKDSLELWTSLTWLASHTETTANRQLARTMARWSRRTASLIHWTRAFTRRRDRCS